MDRTEPVRQDTDNSCTNRDVAVRRMTESTSRRPASFSEAEVTANAQRDSLQSNTNTASHHQLIDHSPVQSADVLPVEQTEAAIAADVAGISVETGTMIENDSQLKEIRAKPQLSHRTDSEREEQLEASLTLEMSEPTEGGGDNYMDLAGEQNASPIIGTVVDGVSLTREEPGESSHESVLCDTHSDGRVTTGVAVTDTATSTVQVIALASTNPGSDITVNEQQQSVSGVSQVKHRRKRRKNRSSMTPLSSVRAESDDVPFPSATATAEVPTAAAPPALSEFPAHGHPSCPTPTGLMVPSGQDSDVDSLHSGSTDFRAAYKDSDVHRQGDRSQRIADTTTHSLVPSERTCRIPMILEIGSSSGPRKGSSNTALSSLPLQPRNTPPILQPRNQSK